MRRPDCGQEQLKIAIHPAENTPMIALATVKLSELRMEVSWMFYTQKTAFFVLKKITKKMGTIKALSNKRLQYVSCYKNWLQFIDRNILRNIKKPGLELRMFCLIL